jgi:hypothetical protein
MKCPSCGTESDGSFCPSCGAPLTEAKCRACDAVLVPGARFCTACGEPVRPPSSTLPWIVTGIALAALIVVLLLPVLRPSPRSTGGAVAAGPFVGGGAGSPPPLTGTPREQADRLFNRIMQERAAGNDQQVEFFLPMALTAYEQAGPLDADGLYHLGLLQIVAGRNADASASAARILQTEPHHLLGLIVAAQAAVGAGDIATARADYRLFMDHFDEEKGRQLAEYLDHAAILPEYRREAEEFLQR